MELRRIKVLVMDVDGTLTDGKIYMGKEGELMKAFDIKDGCGIHDILLPSGIIPLIITGRKSKILENRCQELRIENLYQGVQDKKSKLIAFMSDIGLNFSDVAYIGDDINDLPCMQVVKDGGGVIGCPKDAVNAVRQIASFISNQNGGNGAVREFIDYVVNL